MFDFTCVNLAILVLIGLVASEADPQLVYQQPSYIYPGGHPVYKMAGIPYDYSSVPNRRAGLNKRAGKSCDGYDNFDRECCSTAAPCAINEGDCDKDSECQGNLICGKNNCPSTVWDRSTVQIVPSFFPSTADCCEGKNCDGVNYDRECCSVEAPCAIDEGDCDNDSECQGDLVCGSNNCYAPFPSGADCCELEVLEFVLEEVPPDPSLSVFANELKGKK